MNAAEWFLITAARHLHRGDKVSEPAQRKNGEVPGSDQSDPKGNEGNNPITYNGHLLHLSLVPMQYVFEENNAQP